MLKNCSKYLFYILLITGCATINEASNKDLISSDKSNFKFTSVTNLSSINLDNRYAGEYIFLIPEIKDHQSFNMYYQLGILKAYSDLKIINNLRFVDENTFDEQNFENAYFIGPFKTSLVKKLERDSISENFLFMNLTSQGDFIAPSSRSQINFIEKFLETSYRNQINLIGNENQIKNFQELSKEQYPNIKKGVKLFLSSSPERDIPSILKINESHSRFQILNNKNSQDFNFTPRARKDFKNILLVPETEEELYEYSSLIRFHYGLDYNIYSLSYNLNKITNESELEIHGINIIDVSYISPYGFDLDKNRSFSTGYDAMLISFARKNRVYGEIRGLSGIYYLNSTGISRNAYLN